MTTVKKMMLASIFIVVSISSSHAQKLQKKVGTNPTITNPSAVLEVESTTKGFLPPRMTIEQMTAIVTPPAGLMVYCTNCIPEGLCVFDGTIWTQLASTTNTWIDANCSSNGFSGTITSGIPLSGATFTTTITNDSFNTAGPFSFSASDLVLSGVSGLVVGTPSPASVNINPRSSQLITYPITGTPASTGTLTGTWTNGSFTCSNTKEVGIPADITLTSAAETTNQIAMSSATITPITYTVTGTGVSNVDVTGLPAGVTHSYNSGTLTISGTPTVNGDFTFTITTLGGDPNDTATGRISVVIVESSFSEFSGSVISGIPLSNVTFNTTITNNSTNAVGPISFSAGDLVLSGVSAGLVVGTPSPALAIINPESSQLISYPITGTPTSSGTLIGTWTNELLTYTETSEIGTPATITLTSAAETTNQIAMSSATITPITYTVTGTGVSNVTVTGLPAGVTYSYNSGTLTISGTPTVNGDYSYTITTVGGIPSTTATGRIAVVIVDCSSNGFSGTFASGITLSGASFSMTITNSSSNAVGPISFSASDLVLSGVNAGLVVGTPSPASASINPGGSQLITYPITGSPASAGTLTGTWTNGLLSCSNTKEVGNPALITLTSASDTNNQIAMSSATITPITYTVTGTGVSNVDVTGLPAGVTHSYNSGTLTISGTPTENGDFTYTIATLGGDPNATATGRIAVVIVDCSSNGFSGTIASGIPLSGASFSMTITNSSSNAVGPISFSASNLVLSGVNAGLAVGTPSPASASINPGGSQLITYPITGTPSSTGTLTGTWTNGLLSCSNTKEVINPVPAAFTLTSAASTTNQLVIPSNSITTITYSVTGTGVTSVTATGLPAGVTSSYNTTTGVLTISGGSSAVSGNYNYTLTTVGGVSNASTTGVIRVMIKDRMYGITDNGGSNITHNFVYLPVTGPDGKTWLNNNLGAHYAWINGGDYSPGQQATSRTDYKAYGNLFQWGRKPDGHERVNYSNTTTGVAVHGTTTINSTSPTNALFITETSSPYDWRSTRSTSLWAAESSTNNPCPVGYRVPTLTELDNLFPSGSTYLTAFNSSLKFTTGGNRLSSNGSLTNTGTSGYYWTSSSYNNQSSYVLFSFTSELVMNDGHRAMGAAVRCIKN